VRADGFVSGAADEQLSATAELFEADTLTLVDVGGDILTHRKDPGLRSPLADQLALAACLRTDLPTRLVIAAPAIDGELDTAMLNSRLEAAHAELLEPLTAADLAPIQGVFTWHPSEASGLLAAAANGARGRVEIREPATRSYSQSRQPACTAST